MGIVNQDRYFTVHGRRLAGCQGEEGLGFVAGQDFHAVIHEPDGGLFDILDRSARQGIMELGKGQVAHDLQQVVSRV